MHLIIQPNETQIKFEQTVGLILYSKLPKIAFGDSNAFGLSDVVNEKTKMVSHQI